MVTTYDSSKAFLAQQSSRQLILWLEEWDRIGKRGPKGRDLIVIDGTHFGNEQGILFRDEIRRELNRRGHIERIAGWAGSRRRFWRLVHNAVAHPLLETGTDWSVRFHDWTGDLAWAEV